MAIRLDLNMNSGSAAFTGNEAGEVARILRAFADMIETGREGHFHLRDLNGNGCGGAFFEVWDDEEADA